MPLHFIRHEPGGTNAVQEFHLVVISLTNKVFLFINGALSIDRNAKIFFFYKDQNVVKSVSFGLENAVTVKSHPLFDQAKTTMLYSHGYLESAESDTVQAIVEAYIANGNYNILVIDWRELADGIYPLVSSDLAKLGQDLAKQILLMGMLDRLHFVGHSLGGQLAGYVGKAIISLSGGTQKLKRISALDPAGPDFYLIRINTQHLTKNDAKFVDVIHTDGGFLGYPTNTGTVDFYVNGGHRSQPGCVFIIDLLCSHQRSVYLWAESVQKGSAVSFLSFSPGSPDPIQMGNNCPLSATGAYYVSTANKSPYSLS